MITQGGPGPRVGSLQAEGSTELGSAEVKASSLQAEFESEAHFMAIRHYDEEVSSQAIRRCFC